MPAPFIPALLDWYDRRAADLPWRSTKPDAYRIWLSEIMLQQTRVDTVIPYYERFLTHYPDVQALAAASLDDVLKRWEGLGYYSRARNLHQTARIVAEENDGKFPKDVVGLLALPGIGRYTAGAIASIAYGVRAPVLDGNVMRVFARLTDLPDDVTQSATQKKLWSLADEWLPEEHSDGRYGDYNQSLMELGRLVCTPKNPNCNGCPIREFCKAYVQGTQAERPVKKKKAPTPHYDVSAGLIRDGENRLLIGQRPLDGLLGGLWEFPGGKQENGETLPECLQRELREELAIEVEVGDLFVAVKHAFTHFKITLHAFECVYVSGPPQKIGVRDYAWVDEDDLDKYSFGKADRQVIAALKKRRGMLL